MLDYKRKKAIIPPIRGKMIKKRQIMHEKFAYVKKKQYFCRLFRVKGMSFIY